MTNGLKVKFASLGRVCSQSFHMKYAYRAPSNQSTVITSDSECERVSTSYFCNQSLGGKQYENIFVGNSNQSKTRFLSTEHHKASEITQTLVSIKKRLVSAWSLKTLPNCGLSEQPSFGWTSYNIHSARSAHVLNKVHIPTDSEQFDDMNTCRVRAQRLCI